ncbi:MAG: ABC transporter permease [Bacteroidales bacterium]|jgi:putative ABC transport system permease protein|nr:ABC transporter permease [Bacteroidales bacterium]
MIWSVSWRNVWRSKTRSLVIISAIALGVFAGVYTIAFMFGWVNQRVDNVIMTEVSHIQIHHADYIQTNEVHDYITDINSIKDNIETMPNVAGVSTRLIATCMVSSAETGSGVQMVGVNPENEQKVTNLYTKIIDGAYFEGVKRNPIVIGEKLANKLKVKVRSKIVVTVTEMNGTLTGGAFRVAGIFKTANSTYDEMRAFVKMEDLQNLIKIEDNAGHEIAVLMNKNNIENVIADQIRTEYPTLQTMTWTQLVPDMKMMNESMNFMMYIFVVIILLALGFGIVNTMLMVILERVKELGMLMAVGMSRLRVFSMIVLETIFLSLVGGVVGIALAIGLTLITGKTGVDLSLWAEGLSSAGFDSIVYPEIGFDSVIVVTILVIITGILSSIYPARKAIKLNPAEAIRIE